MLLIDFGATHPAGPAYITASSANAGDAMHVIAVVARNRLEIFNFHSTQH
jgi:hypothetical protein